ncbi:hypothetical protein [Methanogenium sp. MK-MG]|uniref:hypothetical protein n=1 Tax=Methanogenium sp. MK-MG TaxID=2599926 RepID=UPI0013EA0E74|nr:hypothetical protein [Methanogenium sp. MK-MG]KAF1076635.1 hypothetical protein MKMG_01449 [Methanogenium sp. MK-MG]
MVRISGEGEKILPEMKELSEEWADILFSNFSDEEKETALEVLKKMALNVSSHMREKDQE